MPSVAERFKNIEARFGPVAAQQVRGQYFDYFSTLPDEERDATHQQMFGEPYYPTSTRADIAQAQPYRTTEADIAQAALTPKHKYGIVEAIQEAGARATLDLPVTGTLIRAGHGIDIRRPTESIARTDAELPTWAKGLRTAETIAGSMGEIIGLGALTGAGAGALPQAALFGAHSAIGTRVERPEDYLPTLALRTGAGAATGALFPSIGVKTPTGAYLRSAAVLGGGAAAEAALEPPIVHGEAPRAMDIVKAGLMGAAQGMALHGVSRALAEPIGRVRTRLKARAAEVFKGKGAAEGELPARLPKVAKIDPEYVRQNFDLVPKEQQFTADANVTEHEATTLAKVWQTVGERIFQDHIRVRVVRPGAPELVVNGTPRPAVIAEGTNKNTGLIAPVIYLDAELATRPYKVGGKFRGNPLTAAGIIRHELTGHGYGLFAGVPLSIQGEKLAAEHARVSEITSAARVRRALEGRGEGVPEETAALGATLARLRAGAAKAAAPKPAPMPQEAEIALLRQALAAAKPKSKAARELLGRLTRLETEVAATAPAPAVVEEPRGEQLSYRQLLREMEKHTPRSLVRTTTEEMPGQPRAEIPEGRQRLRTLATSERMEADAARLAADPYGVARLRLADRLRLQAEAEREPGLLIRERGGARLVRPTPEPAPAIAAPTALPAPVPPVVAPPPVPEPTTPLERLRAAAGALPKVATPIEGAKERLVEAVKPVLAPSPPTPRVAGISPDLVQKATEIADYWAAKVGGYKETPQGTETRAGIHERFTVINERQASAKESRFRTLAERLSKGETLTAAEGDAIANAHKRVSAEQRRVERERLGKPLATPATAETAPPPTLTAGEGAPDGTRMPFAANRYIKVAGKWHMVHIGAGGREVPSPRAVSEENAKALESRWRGEPGTTIAGVKITTKAAPPAPAAGKGARAAPAPAPPVAQAELAPAPAAERAPQEPRGAIVFEGPTTYAGVKEITPRRVGGGEYSLLIRQDAKGSKTWSVLHRDYHAVEGKNFPVMLEQVTGTGLPLKEAKNLATRLIERGETLDITRPFVNPNTGQRHTPIDIAEKVKPPPPVAPAPLAPAAGEGAGAPAAGGLVWSVGVSKDYFPKELRPKGIGGFYEVVKVNAASRTEAARLAWDEHGQRWLSLMGPQQTGLPRLVSLHAGRVGSVTGAFNRLTPIRVSSAKVAPAAPPPTPPPTPAGGNKYYIRTDAGFVEVQAEPVTIPGARSLDAFARLEGKNWVVTEGKSGLQFGAGATREEALASAAQAISKRGLPAVESFIEQHTVRGGVSPRWEGSYTPGEQIQLGEKVVRVVPGLGGIPMRVTGTVYKGKSGWRVKVDSGQPVGGAKTQELTIEWRRSAGAEGARPPAPPTPTAGEVAGAAWEPGIEAKLRRGLPVEARKARELAPERMRRAGEEPLRPSTPEEALARLKKMYAKTEPGTARGPELREAIARIEAELATSRRAPSGVTPPSAELPGGEVAGVPFGMPPPRGPRAKLPARTLEQRKTEVREALADVAQGKIVSAAERAVLPVRKYMEMQGPDGAELGTRLRNTVEYGMSTAGELQARLKDVTKGLTSRQAAELSRIVDPRRFGRPSNPADHLDPNVREANRKWQALTREYVEAVNKAGFKATYADGTKGPVRIQDAYMTQALAPQGAKFLHKAVEVVEDGKGGFFAKDTTRFRAVAEEMVRRGLVKDTESARYALAPYGTYRGKATPPEPGVFFGPLSRTLEVQLPASVYDPNTGKAVQLLTSDFRIIAQNWVSGVSKALAVTEHLGQNLEKVKPFLDRLAAQGKDAEAKLFRKYFQRVAGQEEGGAPASFINFITRAAGSAGMSSPLSGGPKNFLLGMIADLTSHGGPIPYLTAVARTLRHPKLAAARARRSGAFAAGEIMIRESALGGPIRKAVGAISLYPGTERLNRTLSAEASWAGAELALERLGAKSGLASKATFLTKPSARRYLESTLDLEPARIAAALKAGKWAPEDRAIIALRGSNRIQGSTDVASMPGWMTAPSTRGFALFQRMAYRGTVRMLRDPVMQTAKGNPQGLALQGLGAVAIGAGLGWLRRTLLGQEEPEKERGLAAKTWGRAMRGEGLGVLSNVFDPTYGGLSADQIAIVRQTGNVVKNVAAALDGTKSFTQAGRDLATGSIALVKHGESFLRAHGDPERQTWDLAYKQGMRVAKNQEWRADVYPQPSGDWYSYKRTLQESVWSKDKEDWEGAGLLAFGYLLAKEGKTPAEAALQLRQAIEARRPYRSVPAKHHQEFRKLIGEEDWRRFEEAERKYRARAMRALIAMTAAIGRELPQMPRKPR